MKHHQLHYLSLLAAHGSLRAAARVAGVSAASVAQGLQELEQDTQLALVARHGKHTALTPAGQALLPQAQRVCSVFAQAEAAAQALRDEQAPQRLSIGVTPWVAQTLLSQVVPLFRDRMPHVQLELIDGLSGVAYPRLREGALDLMIGRMAVVQGMEGLEGEALFRYEMTVVARRGHPKAGASSLAELLDNDWIVNFTPEEHPAYMHNLFGQHGFSEPRQRIHLAHSAALILALVRQTDMLTFCPWPLVETMELRETVVPLTLRERFKTNTVGIVRRRQQVLSPAAQVFVEVFREVALQWRESADVRLRRVLHAVDFAMAGD
jgi:LysR family transcriptional regulator of abg operon